MNYISCSIFRIFQSWVPYLNFLTCYLFLSSFNFLYSPKSHFFSPFPFLFFLPCFPSSLLPFPFSFLIPLFSFPSFSFFLSVHFSLPPLHSFFLSFPLPIPPFFPPSYSFPLALTSFHSSSASPFPSTCLSFHRIGPLNDLKEWFSLIQVAEVPRVYSTSPSVANSAVPLVKISYDCLFQRSGVWRGRLVYASVLLFKKRYTKLLWSLFLRLF